MDFQWRCRPVIVEIPYHKIYVEVFGGTGIQLLVKDPSELEVYNDRYGGITEYFDLRDVPNGQGHLADPRDRWRFNAQRWAHTQVLDLEMLYARYRDVILEDLPWERMFDDFDSPDTVFHCEFPPNFQDRKLVENYAKWLKGEVIYGTLHEAL